MNGRARRMMLLERLDCKRRKLDQIPTELMVAVPPPRIDISGLSDERRRLIYVRENTPPAMI